MWDQSEKNIPRYDPVIDDGILKHGKCSSSTENGTYRKDGNGERIEKLKMQSKSLFRN